MNNPVQHNFASKDNDGFLEEPERTVQHKAKSLTPQYIFQLTGIIALSAWGHSVRNESLPGRTQEFFKRETVKEQIATMK